MDYALVKNSIVENIIVADQEFIDSIMDQYEHIEAIDTLAEQNLNVSIGWNWNIETGFTNPNPTINVPQKRLISVGSFFDRFGSLKYQILADVNPVVQALVKDATVRTHINLDDPLLVIALTLLNSNGYEIDVEAFINTPLTSSEII